VASSRGIGRRFDHIHRVDSLYFFLVSIS